MDRSAVDTLTGWAHGVTRCTADAEDVVQAALLTMLEKGEDLTLPKAWGYTKNMALRLRESQARTMAHAPATLASLTEGPEPTELLLVSIERCRKRFPNQRVGYGKNGVGSRLPLFICPVCGVEAKHKLRNDSSGIRVETCGKPTCVARWREQKKRMVAA
jgi:hypothetical protein